MIARYFAPFLGFVLLLLGGCVETVPYSERKAINLVSESQMRTLGARSFEEIRSKSKLSQNAVFNEQVQRVGARMARVVPTQERFEFFVFEDDKQVNAFALPGGKVVVYTGILKLIQSDDELAVVLGHEIAHVTAHHGNERMSQQMLVGALSTGLAMAMEGKESQKAVMGVFGAGANLGVLLPFSRTHELEADRIGLIYAAQAGYDPSAALSFWQRMQQSSQGKKPPELLSTHPSDAHRINHMQTVCIPAAKARAAASGGKGRVP